MFKRDTYRYSGRGNSGFSMHYQECQCSRLARVDGYCAQHAKLVADGVALSLWELPSRN